ncbi:MAG: UDP-N-acetylglucosamine 1-carboxyvinyltransferase [Alphaproteobacteria bacterium]|nr:UDP-N-acetylglucosamine 1-carboxyvinyltransferase [Alphaproteobacteria bacterium]
MDKIRIRGGRTLRGEVVIHGAKNAALPLMAACLLTDETLVLGNLPHLADITTLVHLLGQHGVIVRMDGGAPNGGNDGRVLALHAERITRTIAPYNIVRKMRASVLVLGPLLAREGTATVSLPGGCAIGTRPIDLHLSALEQMGAKVELKGGYVHALAPRDGLKGAEIRFPVVSVGATENIMMAATLAKGQTILHNAAREPEVTDLAHCLIAMGAKIGGVGTDTLTVEGRDRLGAAEYTVLPDRIEAGTYAFAAAITGGEIEVVGGRIEHLDAAVGALQAAGVTVAPTERGFRVTGYGRLKAVDITTQPYPGFPTDLQAQFMALMTLADGASMITETIFENRFMHVPELTRMGADITVRGNTALVRGAAALRGAPVMATDLRASVSLVLAALAAEGETIVNRVYHLDRGYERLEERLRSCGADIERLRE